ncbi:hypothetical protein HanRHA438_Chr03g0129361 [Helianthus annuus]|nr:putative RING domain-containing protein NIP1/2 [Helianthus annuus]KAJ0608556.1 putative RING domain-containing protein NIP1/2 [Helianthus annuus]KAJ0768623.1 putative RING domain-containing protein NIP1/2 [Helianthus annuus]KAJ0774367.1 putative RING domain-containing protein NIP1/2 [Helianthus annuus]KAJ0936315.1 hypothetical protein HanRHA438_Chr03g0129361 [Helianthus annuus]
MDMIIDGEPFSKVSFLSSLVNGQVFADWVTPAVLKAYQSQASMIVSANQSWPREGSGAGSPDPLSTGPKLFKKCSLSLYMVGF